MTDHPDWPDQAIEDWLQMERHSVAFAAEMDKDLQRVTDEQVKEYERAAAVEKALEAWRM